MSESKTYAANLEKKLIDEFKEKFESKLGYTPIVLTRVSTEDVDNFPMMSLEELSEYFEPYLPVYFGKTLTLDCKVRKRELVELRNIFCAIARMMKFTTVSIGEFLGGRDHTTVLHNLGTFKNLIETSDAFREKYFTIVNRIKLNHESSTLGELNQTQRQPQPAVLP